jgi:drug/metabolite transporter (DMT)-like permease
MVESAVTASWTASILLALLAAFLFAVSAAVQHHAAGLHAREMAAIGDLARDADQVPDPVSLPDPPLPRAVAVAERARPATAVVAARRRLRLLVLLGRLVRDPVWLLGWVANVAGFAAQAAALHLGSIVIVQALLVTQLLFALPLSSVSRGRRPLRRDWLGTAAVCAGLVTLLAVRGAVPQTAGRRSEVWLLVSAAGGIILLLLLVSRLVGGYGQQYRTSAVAAAAGICFCLTAVFLVLIGDDFARSGVLSTLLGWPLLGLCGSTLLGLLLVQDAFAGGSLPAAMTAMAITDPLASWVAGILLFDARPQLSVAALSGYGVAAGLIAVGVGALANSPTLRDESRSPGTR